MEAKGKRVSTRKRAVLTLISQTKRGESISAYVVLHPSGKHVATVQVQISRIKETKGMRIDVFEAGFLSYQISTEPESYPYSRAFAGFKLADVELYGDGAGNHANNGTSRACAGLDCLKAAGYKIIKAI